jgi:hypothetical protein
VQLRTCSLQLSLASDFTSASCVLRSRYILAVYPKGGCKYRESWSQEGFVPSQRAFNRADSSSTPELASGYTNNPRHDRSQSSVHSTKAVCISHRVIFLENYSSFESCRTDVAIRLK